MKLRLVVDQADNGTFTDFRRRIPKIICDVGYLKSQCS